MRALESFLVGVGYLGSGMVKGIGPVYAKKLVDRFGEGVFDIIEKASARLEDVDGIGPMRRKRIKAAWDEQKVIRDIMLFLHSNGVSTSRAVRIYRTYGESAIEKVRNDPYRLAREIHGIGFKTADQIARKIGIPVVSLVRACAGLNHVLLEATGDGHCALPVELLKDEAGKLLLVEEKIVSDALERTVATNDLVKETINGQELVFLPHLKRAEKMVADRIRSLASSPSSFRDVSGDHVAVQHHQIRVRRRNRGCEHAAATGDADGLPDRRLGPADALDLNLLTEIGDTKGYKGKAPR